MSTALGASQYAGPKGASTRPRLERWRLESVTSQLNRTLSLKPPQAIKEWSAGQKDSLELPTINPSYLCRPSRFIYGFTDHGLSTLADGIGKYDTFTHSALRWSEPGHTPGEPIFVKNPLGEHEDDGVLLNVVLDGHSGRSYLLVLDAKNFEVLGKAHCEWPVGFGFHGIHIGTKALGRAVDV